MKRLFILINLLFIPILCFAQVNNSIKITGRIPDASDARLYQLQVGAYRITKNAENSYGKLIAASLNPSYEKYRDLTRVLIKGIKAADVPAYIEKIKRAGFAEVYIKIDPSGVMTPRLPVSTAAQPSSSSREIGNRSDKVSEPMNLTEDIHNLIPDNILEAIEDIGIEINGGKSPPNIEGTYFVDTLQLVKTTTGTDIAKQWNKYVTFSGQDNTTLTINVDYTMQTENSSNPMSSKGPGSYIVGEGNKFTVVVDGTREQAGYTAKTVEIFSGEISDTGIINYHWAVMMIDNNGNPLDIWIQNSTGYTKKDGDGFSERVKSK
jgi:hypothetical protein